MTTVQQLAAIAIDWEHGYTAPEIAKRYGVKPSYVYYMAAKKFEPAAARRGRRTKYAPNIREEIIRLWANKPEWSQWQIANHLGTTQATVSRVICGHRRGQF